MLVFVNLSSAKINIIVSNKKCMKNEEIDKDNFKFFFIKLHEIWRENYTSMIILESLEKLINLGNARSVIGILYDYHFKGNLVYQWSK